VITCQPIENSPSWAIRNLVQFALIGICTSFTQKKNYFITGLDKLLGLLKMEVAIIFGP